MPDNIQRIPNKFQGLFALIAQFYSLTQCENKQNKTTKNNDIVNNFEQRKKVRRRCKSNIGCAWYAIDTRTTIAEDPRPIRLTLLRYFVCRQLFSKKVSEHWFTEYLPKVALAVSHVYRRYRYIKVHNKKKLLERYIFASRYLICQLRHQTYLKATFCLDCPSL